MRNTVPFGVGGTPLWPTARSVEALASRGNSLVVQSSVMPLPPVARRLAWTGASDTTIALPCASWPVTILRVDLNSMVVSFCRFQIRGGSLGRLLYTALHE